MLEAHLLPTIHPALKGGDSKRTHGEQPIPLPARSPLDDASYCRWSSVVCVEKRTVPDSVWLGADATSHVKTRPCSQTIGHGRLIYYAGAVRRRAKCPTRESFQKSHALGRDEWRGILYVGGRGYGGGPRPLLLQRCNSHKQHGVESQHCAGRLHSTGQTEAPLAASECAKRCQRCAYVVSLSRGT